MIVNPHQRLNRSGFTLVELLVVVVIMMLGLSWVLPQYRRQQALTQLDQYTQQVESGLFHLRARQSSEGTSCEINFDPTYIGTANTSSGFGRPSDVLELGHLSWSEQLRSDDRSNVMARLGSFRKSVAGGGRTLRFTRPRT